MSNVITVNCELYWGFFDRKNDMSGKYQVDLTSLSDKAVSALEDLGVKVNNKGDERGNYITVKSSNPIKVLFDTKDEPSVSSIGNGSTAKASVGYYDWDFRGKKGRSPSLKKLVVTDVVVYEGGAAAEEFDMDSAL